MGKQAGNIDSVVEFLAKCERDFIWPVLSQITKNNPGIPKTGHVAVAVQRNGKRKILNHAEMTHRMCRNFTYASQSYHCLDIDFAKIVPFELQILIFARASFMFGSHGAGLTGALWMHRGSTLLDIRALSNSRLFFRLLSLDFGLQYLAWRENNGNHDDADIVVGHVEAILTKPHLPRSVHCEGWRK